MRQLVPYVVLFLLSGAPVSSQATPGQKLDAAIGELIQACAKPSSRQRKVLDALIEEYGTDRDLVRSRRYPLERIALHLAFAEAQKDVELDDLVSGKLVKWDERSGKIELRYSKDDRDDWQTAPPWSLHPVHFTDSLEISFSGRAYGGSSEPAMVQIMTGEDGSAVVVQFGLSGAGSAYPTSIWLQKGKDEKELLDKGGISPCEAGQPFSISLRVSRGRVQAFADRKRILQAKLPVDRSIGQVRVRDFPWEEAKIEGVVDPGWLSGLAATQRRKQIEEFSKNTKLTDLLPAWLFEDPPVERDRRRDPSAPPKQLGKAQDALRDGLDLDMRGKSDLLAQRLETYGRQGLTEQVLEFLRSSVLRDQGRLPEALAAARKSRQLDPEFYRAYDREYELAWAMGDHEACTRVAQDSIGRFGTAAQIQELWIGRLISLARGDLAEQQLAVLRRGAGEAKGGPLLAAQERLAWHVRYGGPLRFGESRKSFGPIELRYTCDDARARTIGRAMRESIDAFHEAFPELEAARPANLRVVLFATAEEKDAFFESVGEPEAYARLEYQHFLAVHLGMDLASLMNQLRFDYAFAVALAAVGQVPPLLSSGLCLNFRPKLFEIGDEHLQQLRSGTAQLPTLQTMLVDGMDLHPGLVRPYGALLLQHLATTGEENRAILGAWIQRVAAGYRGRALLEAPFDTATCRRLDAELKQRL